MIKNFTEDLPWELLAKCISGNADLTEQKNLEIWVSKNSENQNTYLELQKLWVKEFEIQETESEKDKVNKELAWNKLKSRIDTLQHQKKTSFFSLKPYVFAASFIGIIILAYFLYVTFFSNSENLKMISVANDKTTPLTVRLPDGSTVILNKETKISYPEQFKKRMVELEGEAFFNVAHLTESKFIVNAPNLSVEVLGTIFNFKAYKDKNATLTVESGKVLFKSKNNNSMTLTAGQSAAFDISTQKLIPKTDINAFAWKSKVFKFQNTPVAEIIETLESNFNVKIKSNQKDLLKCEFNGVFENTQPEFILQAMAFSLGMKINFENGVYLLNGEGCNKN